MIKGHVIDALVDYPWWVAYEEDCHDTEQNLCRLRISVVEASTNVLDSFGTGTDRSYYWRIEEKKEDTRDDWEEDDGGPEVVSAFVTLRHMVVGVRVMPQLLVSCQICNDILGHIGVAAFEKSREVEGERKCNHWENVESWFLPGHPTGVANAQVSFKGDGDGGVDGAGEANVEKGIGDLVDHSVKIRVRVAGKGTIAKDGAIADDEKEIEEGEIYEQFEKGLFP